MGLLWLPAPMRIGHDSQKPFKGSLTAAMIDRVDCPAKQRDRIRMGTIHYPPGNTPTGGLGSPFVAEQGTRCFASPLVFSCYGKYRSVTCGQ